MIKFFIVFWVWLVAFQQACPLLAQNKSHLHSNKNQQYHSAVATTWMNFIATSTKRQNITPTACLRLYAYTGIALYESQIAENKKMNSLFYYLTNSKIPINPENSYHVPTIANVAIARLLKKMNVLTNTPSIDSTAAVLALGFKDITDKNISFQSEQLGNKIAEAIYEWSTSDGNSINNNPYKPLTGAGMWTSSENASRIQNGFNQGSFRTFNTNIKLLADPGHPLAYDTNPGSAFYLSALEVYQLRKNISHEDSLLVISWQNKAYVNFNTISHLTCLLTGIIEKEQINLKEASILYARHGIAMFDAITVSFFHKHQYNLINPSTYINSVFKDPQWATVYPYNFFPSYPSNFSAIAHASIGIIKERFGNDYPFTDSTNTAKIAPFVYTSFDAYVSDIEKQLLVSGLEYRFSIKAGGAIGKIAAKKTMEIIPVK